MAVALKPPGGAIGSASLVLIALGAACSGGGSRDARTDLLGQAAAPMAVDALSPGAVVPAQAAAIDLAVITSSDWHGQVAPPASPPQAPGGLARRATQVDRARLEAKAVLQVDAGDFLPAVDDPNFAGPAFERRARLILAAYHRMDVDAVTLGPRELDVDIKTLRRWFHESKLPVVLANVTGADGKPLFPAQHVAQVGEHKIGIFGVVALGAEATALRQRHKLTVSDPLAAATAAVAALRAEGAELIVGLFHVAAGARDRPLAAAVSGVDIVVQSRASEANLARIDAHAELATSGAASRWRFAERALDLGPAVGDQRGVGLLVAADTTKIVGLVAPGAKGRPAKKPPGQEVYESWTFASARACADCHAQQAEQWATTDHAHAMATLKKKGRERDPACVGCHSVAFLLPGGTVNLDTLNTYFADVACEACHGPGVAHVRSMNKKLGTSRQVGPLVCLGCHTPDQSQGPFDYATALKEVIGPGHGLPPQAKRVGP
jgi:5'-nucleotidase